GGGEHPGDTCMDLLIDGKPVRTSTGPNDRPGGSEKLGWYTWDVRQFSGREARLQIVDRFTGGWGHVNVDHVYLSDVARSDVIVSRYTGNVAFADFNGDDYGEWIAEGDAFGTGPKAGLADSRGNGGGATGTLASPAFTIDATYINVRLGGGNWSGLVGAELVVDDDVVRRATGTDEESTTWASWDVTAYESREARIRVFDRYGGLFGYTIVDEITMSGTPKASPTGDATESGYAASRQRLLDAGANELVFATRGIDPDGHWYANFSYWSNNPTRTLYHEGGQLYKLDLKTGHAVALIDDPAGGVRDPQVHYDGEKILFSYRKGGQPFYHLYEINTDGTGLRQLTDGPYDDIEPTYLPDGDIIFCSSRCNRMVNCYYVRVAVLYRCDGGGGDIRPLSANVEQDNTPWVLADGRVIYQRWEYVDRSQVAYHHLWTANPDGTEQMVFYGNLNPSTVMIDAKPMPNSRSVVASFSPGHGRREHEGHITIVDPGAGPDESASARRISKGRLFHDPYPITEDLFLVAGGTEVLLMDGDGRVESLFDLRDSDKLAGLRAHEPRPIRPRPREHVVPSKSDRREPTGRVLLTDVYNGRNMDGVVPGEIKKLLVLETLPKPVNFSGGWEPLSYGGTFTLERIVGTVPVEKDGSAYFELPASRSFFLAALDENDVAVKRMQSFFTVQPGETLSCGGCHEHRGQTAQPATNLLAGRRDPSPVSPVEGVPEVIDFPRDIQPIIDRHCVACHDYDATEQGGPRAGGVILSGDRGPMYSHSYINLTVHGQIADGRNLSKSNYPPRALGSAGSPIMHKLAPTHYGVETSESERALVRWWLDSAAAYAGTYAALGSGAVGGQGWGDHTSEVLDRRCVSCHGDPENPLPRTPGDWMGVATSGVIRNDDPRVRHSRELVFNLSRPEKSLYLLAPLAEAAGGYGACGGSVFASTDDDDYQTLLTAVGASQDHLARIRRFDMDGFRPNVHYIREMGVYGVLQPDLAADVRVDPYETDQAYWRSLWHKPP
ncbi:MAG TPA: hypothetical protein QGH10_10715, partial [Armatimonadota bacterium]|nr:hypothetical protein [Armatimonadota bacterium]